MGGIFMSKQEKIAVLEAIRRRYQKASRQQKKVILDEFCATCQYHRKHAIRLLQRRRKPQRGQVGRKAIYGSSEFMLALKRIWLASDQMCSKRLKATLPLWLPHYAQAFEPLTAMTYTQLLKVSAATMDRLIKPVRLKHPRGLSGTKPGTWLKNQIPIRTNHWDVTKPGFVEADTLAHCGNSLEGDFVWSLTLTDILLGWTESRAIWNKGARDVLTQIKDIESRIPFKLRGFDCDNGSEFLNHHLFRYFATKKEYVQFTRSRPYAQNDNPHVEQKNWAHIRQLFGYDRIERLETVALMNDLYANEWSHYQNHFCPNLKLKTKKRINSKYQKRYESPKTPYQRVIESPLIAPTTKNQLKSLHERLNPFTLKRTIENKLKTIFQLITVTSNVRQRI